MFFSTKYVKVSSNPGKVRFGGFVNFLIHIKDSKRLGLKIYSNIEDAPLSDILRQASIKNENQLMVLSDLSRQDFLDTRRSTRAYIVFFKVDQLSIAHMFQVQLLNIVLVVA